MVEISRVATLGDDTFDVKVSPVEDGYSLCGLIDPDHVGSPWREQGQICNAPATYKVRVTGPHWSAGLRVRYSVGGHACPEHIDRVGAWYVENIRRRLIRRVEEGEDLVGPLLSRGKCEGPAEREGL